MCGFGTGLFFNFLINFGLFFLFLGGCNPFAAYAPTSDHLATKQWAAGKKQPMHKIYCYRTLGEHQCFTEPIKGKEHLLVGEHIITADAPPCEKTFWEKVNIHPFFGSDPNPEKTKREKDAAEKDLRTASY